MITRPLDLVSKLRPEPRSLDALFFVNAGLIGLFFLLAGSRFILAPGLSVDFQLPTLKGAATGATVTTHQITVEQSGQIVIGDGPADLTRLSDWLKAEARKPGEHSLLVKASIGVSTGELVGISNAAKDAGFEVLVAAEEPVTRGGGH